MSQVSPSTTNPLRFSQFTEYRILYSNDLVQKSKVWHDGRCRFFNFNKKLILYNDEGIVIGTHFVGTAALLDQRNKEIKVGGSVWVIIEEVLGVYERDISNLVNAHRDTVDCSEIVNRRVSGSSKAAAANENITPKASKVVKSSRRVGLSKTSSPSYLARMQGAPLTPTTPEYNKVVELPQKLVSGYAPGPTPVRTPLNRNAPAEFAHFLRNHDRTPTRLHEKRSTIDVLASDGEADISEEVSDLEVDFHEEEGLTQTRTYNI